MAVKSATIKQIKSTLSGWDARWRAAQSLAWFPRGLTAGMVITLMLALAARFWPIVPSQQLLNIGIGIAAAAALIAIAAVWLWRRSHLQMARRFDSMFDLQNRLSTALELDQEVIATESIKLKHLQLERAWDSTRSAQTTDGLRIHIDWRWWASALVLAILAGLAILLPNPQDDTLAQQAEVDQAIAQSIVELEQLKSNAETDPLLPDAQREAVIATLDEAINTLSQPGITQTEALAALSGAEDELRDQSAQFAEQQQQALEAASGTFGNSPADAAGQALSTGDFAAAGEALQNLDVDSLSAEQQQSLAQALGDAAQAVEESNPELAQQLGQAAEALQNGDTQGAEEALGQAGEQISQQGQQGQQGQQSGQQGQGQQGQQGNQVGQYANGVGQQGQNVAKSGKTPKRPDQTNQPGQSGMQQAPQFQPGQGQGQGQTPSQQGGGGAGRGEGDGEPDAPGSNTQPLDPDNGPGDGGLFDFDDIFSPQRVGGEGGDQVDIPGNPDAGQPTGNEGEFAANPSGNANVPYADVYNDYAGVVNQALDSGLVPLGLKDLIKSYFTSLDPNN